MDTEAGRVAVLLAEDDMVSREFLGEAIRACGAQPSACADGPAALDMARRRRWDLLIFDQHLPGRNGDAVLAALRSDRAAASHDAPALATTAEPDTARAALLAAGFAEVLPKPVALETLRAALARHGVTATTLDDAAALRVCGSQTALCHLRRLFAERELPQIAAELERHRIDHHDLRPTLHRLRAACGFCGATRLAEAGEALRAALSHDAVPRFNTPALDAFAAELRATRAALYAALGTAD